MSETRSNLDLILSDELKLAWPHPASLDEVAPELTKRELIRAYTPGWTLAQLIALSRRIVVDLALSADLSRLRALIDAYAQRGGVGSPAKNLIFAANGPKPKLVLRDAVSNDVEITENGQYCLVFEKPIPADGLTFQRLIDWWREREELQQMSDRDVGLHLHDRLLASLGNNGAERLLFDTYSRRYRTHGFDIPALIPQVYLHYDPYTRATRGAASSPLMRQRMDFLLLFSDRHRIVIEVDGRQHYADDTGRANTTLYAEMMAEDRRLRLAGYEVYRFGGKELEAPTATSMLTSFFDDLQQKMA
ncbi:hypothetical protein KIH74_29710 [Kineosporia sp. J2-2]|uniref:AbiJ-NTD3 domain-containing protein n=1 Tax=Kineosporia corallincola TaxID=2835133 RepID=A0ABS5TQ01_9ACTN|nr:hypothetical protein [Kineosporia corallincola]MBT0773157.1 hypothetical protein [Kineosporia corallincola]